MAEFGANFSIIWSPREVAKLPTRRIAKTGEWAMQSHFGTIRFHRSERLRIRLTERWSSFSTSGVPIKLPEVELRLKRLKTFVKMN
jgi:hypothetical protein